MLNKRMFLISAGTVACALGIGFLMQPSTFGSGVSGGVSGGASEGASLQAQPDLPQEPVGTTALAIEKITLTSAAPDASAEPQDLASPERANPLARCDLQASGTAQPGAMVALQVSAPCRSHERVTLHHQGMMVTETLDGDGQLQVTLPALSSSAIFIVETDQLDAEATLAPAGGAVVQVEVLDLAQVDRVVLQWRGNSGFEVHAREFGAQYGENGHVWHGAEAKQGLGHLLQLGDASQLAPRLAEVYSFERSRDAAGAGIIEISVEAEITAINCGREIAAQSLRAVGGAVQSRDLVLNMPDCSAEGDFLVLNNLVENLKIAAK
ncbi:hypothetical protein [Pseudophaeobacter sp.]|uniref:hypothetical protein n=1 Tax=Pseudophaeobacter sp. TaxID=1971739 RepID=UPI0032979E06